MNTISSVNILLASYNGERFIGAQLDSLINQSYKNWQLYIRDDGSSDETLNIIKEYQQKDLRIHLITDELGNLGSCQNFSVLMNTVRNENEYTMFCDQDDVWLPNKIEVTFNKMRQIEKEFTSQTPLLVYTNFQYVDKELKIIQSKKNYSAVKVKHLNFNHLLAQNPVYGCTMMLNKALNQLIDTIPAAAKNHDYWVALAASAFGKIVYVPQSTVFYRQHQLNVSGQHDNDSFRKRFKRIKAKKNLDDVERKIRLANAFKKIYKQQLNQIQLQTIDDFILLSRRKSIRLFIKNWNNGLKRQTFLQTILFYISILFLKSSAAEIENRH